MFVCLLGVHKANWTIWSVRACVRAAACCLGACEQSRAAGFRRSDVQQILPSELRLNQHVMVPLPRPATRLT